MFQTPYGADFLQLEKVPVEVLQRAARVGFKPLTGLTFCNNWGLWMRTTKGEGEFQTPYGADFLQHDRAFEISLEVIEVSNPLRG